MNTLAIYPRLVQPRLTEALADTRVVLIHGPRQRGKTTASDLQLGSASPRLGSRNPDRAVLRTLPCAFRLVP